MSQPFLDLTLYDWLEAVGLLASISGLLTAGASLIVKGMARTFAAEPRFIGLRGGGPLLCATILQRGILYLACGGGFFACAELLEAFTK